ncbi:MAG: DNA cytosine methyltransferase [Candidatus Limiplasma sp.]|jgi:DNA (cytosine-5)-methyltransferase 1|nr:DNA cytosine methyltransferase [Candidatus Limiplasma sp.]
MGICFKGVIIVIDSLELFCGTGGLALGLQQAGFNHKALIEWDKDSCNNINANIHNGYGMIQDWNVIQSDVRTIDFSRKFNGVRLVSGGPPCQPFSLGGKHQAYNDKRDMFPQAVRVVRELKPQAFIFENVKGLLRRSFSSYFNYILLQLRYPEIVIQNNMSWVEHLEQLEQYHTSGNTNGLTYNVVFRLLNAADYGIPQLRHRVVIVGFRNDIDASWTFPAPTHSKEALLYSKWVSGEYWAKHGLPMPSIIPEKDKAAVERVKKNPPSLLPWATVRDALAGLPAPTENGTQIANHEFRGGAKAYPGHSGSVLDEPSKTIKAGAHGVPGGENMLVLDDGTQRYYTVRESARIQTFPDDYLFHGSWTESMRQIGNAVPVQLAKIIGDSVYQQLERVAIDGIEGWNSGHKAV